MFIRKPPKRKQHERTQFSSQTHSHYKKKSIIIDAPFLYSNSIPYQAAFAAESSFLDMFRMTVPDQTLEEAESGIREHAMSLIQVKDLLELELWKEAQKELRKSASYLKQDFYTIIQGKPGTERPQLRNLYSKLFNGVTGLDYAARDKDLPRVWKLCEDIVVTLDNILSKVQFN